MSFFAFDFLCFLTFFHTGSNLIFYTSTLSWLRLFTNALERLRPHQRKIVFSFFFNFPFSMRCQFKQGGYVFLLP